MTERDPRSQGDYARRRLIAVAGLAAGLLALVLVVATSLGGGGEDPPPEESGAEKKPAAKRSAPRRLPTEPGAPQSAAAGTPVSTADWRPSRKPVPILLYHDVESPPANTPLPELHVDAADFRQQMGWLADRGYTGVTMDQLTQAWYGTGTLPRKPVVISFDEGFRSHHEVALPELRRNRWPGVINLRVFSTRGLPDDKTPLPPDQVRDLIDAGWELASHSITGVDLTTVSPAQLKTEVAASRRALERQFDLQVKHFSYPAGTYNRTVAQAVRSAGYKTATTVEEGLGSRDEPFTLKRIRIDASDGLDGFTEKLQTFTG